VYAWEEQGFAVLDNRRVIDNPYAQHCQSIKVSEPLDREEIYELGRRGTYSRFASFPVEVDVSGALCLPEETKCLNQQQ
jgi:hypothetical protein